MYTHVGYCMSVCTYLYVKKILYKSHLNIYIFLGVNINKILIATCIANHMKSP